jgi:hypothetical protein
MGNLRTRACTRSECGQYVEPRALQPPDPGINKPEIMQASCERDRWAELQYEKETSGEATFEAPETPGRGVVCLSSGLGWCLMRRRF